MPMTLLLLALTAVGTRAHVGHMDKVPEDGAISEDPIVWAPHHVASYPLTSSIAGQHTLDSHHTHDLVVRDDHSSRHGPWGIYI